MTLEIKKTIKLVGNMKINDSLVKEVTINIDEHGVSSKYESLIDNNLYIANRTEMRKQEKALRDKQYELEDAILAELENTEETTTA